MSVLGVGQTTPGEDPLGAEPPGGGTPPGSRPLEADSPPRGQTDTSEKFNLPLLSIIKLTGLARIKPRSLT